MKLKTVFAFATGISVGSAITTVAIVKAISKVEKENKEGSVQEWEIKKWVDSEDGERLTITTKDGKCYLVSSVDCILVEE